MRKNLDPEKVKEFLDEFGEKIHNLAEKIRNPLVAGARIRLVRMGNDPDPIPVGTKGTVNHVTSFSDWTQVDIKWDNGRTLMLSLPEDQIELIHEA